ncbi:hypothetical protein [Kordia jejudonensis]|uniref:hypothetical protein n=1 Tax=Kordia jejudonensis TaxID=1348245 RepID=UPI0006294850|nr:hypothetical protein [Kordia jejudonensis]
MKLKLIFTFFILISQISFAQSDISVRSKEFAKIFVAADGNYNQFYLSTKFRGTDKVLTLIENKGKYTVALKEKGKYPNQTWYIHPGGDDPSPKLVNMETDMEIYGSGKNVKVKKRSRSRDKAMVRIRKWNFNYYQFVFYIDTDSTTNREEDDGERALDIYNSKRNAAFMAKPGRYTGQMWFLEKK